ncbi:MAG: hypothetical protein SWY16_09960 [Cyanobacteriota bacterium]|nr:hypothetical protein [Cyanobacteriota bacterium]
MDSTKETIQHCHVDGQHIIIPSLEDWEILKDDPFIDGYEIGLLKNSWFSWFWPRIECVRKYSELEIGLGYLTIKRRFWRPYIFRRMGAKMQRVHLEFLRCDLCPWQGWSANPLVIVIPNKNGTPEFTETSIIRVDPTLKLYHFYSE